MVIVKLVTTHQNGYRKESIHATALKDPVTTAQSISQSPFFKCGWSIKITREGEVIVEKVETITNRNQHEVANVDFVLNELLTRLESESRIASVVKAKPTSAASADEENLYFGYTGTEVAIGAGAVVGIAATAYAISKLFD